jgi:spermidine synthase
MLGKNSSRPEKIYSTYSPHSGPITVWQKGREKILDVGGYTQSVNTEAEGLEGRVWGRIVSEIAKRVASPQSALILGLAGGTEAHLLARQFPGIKIDGVEVDPIVVGVAQEHFGLGEIPYLKVIQADAYDLVKDPAAFDLRAQKFAVIIVDLFVGGSCSSKLDSPEFHGSVRSLRSDEGVAVFNRISGFDKAGFRQELSGAFGGFEEVPVRYGSLAAGNVLFICHG